MRRGRANRTLCDKARIVERLPQTRVRFELCSVRQIDDAGRNVIDGGIVVIAGNWSRSRISKGRREAEQRASAKAARGGGRVPLSNHRLSGGGARGARGSHDRRG